MAGSLSSAGPPGKAVDSDGYDNLYGNTFVDTNTAEIFDPATNTSTLVTGSLHQPRRFHSAILLPTGQVLIAGGVHCTNASSRTTAQYVYPNDLELFDPDTGTFSAMDKLDYGLSEPQMVLLQDGSVFLAGQVQAPMDPPVINNSQPQGMRMRAAADIATLVLVNGMTLLGTIAINPPNIILTFPNTGRKMMGPTTLLLPFTLKQKT